MKASQVVCSSSLSHRTTGMILAIRWLTWTPKLQEVPMAAITVSDIMVLPRLPRPSDPTSERRVRSISTAHKQREGAGFEVRRPFPSMDLRSADPFILLDQMGPVAY